MIGICVSTLDLWPSGETCNLICDWLISPSRIVDIFVVVWIAGIADGMGLNMEKVSIPWPMGVLPVNPMPSVSGESLIIMNGVLCADSKDTAEGGVLSRLPGPNWNVAGDRVRSGIAEGSCSPIDRGVPILHAAAEGVFMTLAGLFPALWMVNDCVMELLSMPMPESSCLNTGESCLLLLLLLAISMPLSCQVPPF